MKKSNVYIIAEAGVNHNGDLEKAFQLVDIASEAQADAIKFQTFKSGECTGRFTNKVNYVERNSNKDESRYDITSKLEMPFEHFKEIQSYCEKKAITFLSTPDGDESLNFITDVLNVSKIKISSTEVTNLQFLKKIAHKNIPVILSTGLSTLGEVEKALEALDYENNDVTTLHCVSEYPAPLEEVNLKAMLTLKNAFNTKIGFSDHTTGMEAGIASVALGAVLIEKHFTYDKAAEGPDHQSSLNPEELKDFVQKIRNTEILMGSGIKKPSKSELANSDGIRRSLVAKENLKAGTILTKENITCKRPGCGIHPYDLDKIIGMKINKDLLFDEPILWEYLK